MAKLTIESAIEQTEALLETLKKLNGANDDGTEALTLPEPDEVASLSKEDVLALATQLGIDSEGVKPSALKALIATAAGIVHEADDLEDDAVEALAEACGLPTAGKPAKVLAAVKAFLEAEKDEEAEESDADSDDDNSGEESDDDEKPKKGKKSAKSDDDDDDSSESNDDDSGDSDDDSGDSDDDDEKPKKGKKKADDDDDADSDDGEEEVSDKEKKLRLAAYNKHAKKPAKSYEAMLASFTDDDGDAHGWGEPYSKDDNGMCCGFPLKDSKHDGEPAGKCRVTGKLFVQNDEGALVEVE